MSKIVKAKKMLRNVVSQITPPIIKSTFLQFSKRNLDPKLAFPPDYSTVDYPIEVPAQVEVYIFCRDKYLQPTDKVLEVGLGLGYGLSIMSAKAFKLAGVDIDKKCVERGKVFFYGHRQIETIELYDGYNLPFPDKSFDVVTCIEVLEHVEDYSRFIKELTRVAKRLVFLATPNQIPLNTDSNGKPKNFWHLREWTKDELDLIFKNLGLNVEWNFHAFENMDQSKEKFIITQEYSPSVFTLLPVIKLQL
jgi:ubiquinone/menaquinone biosynthesis C-methylase UbiE